MDALTALGLIEACGLIAWQQHRQEAGRKAHIAAMQEHVQRLREEGKANDKRVRDLAEIAACITRPE